jgi:hypothetical protein
MASLPDLSNIVDTEEKVTQFILIVWDFMGVLFMRKPLHRRGESSVGDPGWDA